MKSEKSKQTSNRNRRIFVGVLLCAAVAIQCQRSGPRETVANPAPINIEAAAMVSPPAGASNDIDEMLKNDPLAFLRYCREHCDESVSDYRCTFVKQERIKNEIKPEQWMDVSFRQNPFSVFMQWTRNPSLVKKTLYIEGALVKDGKPHAWVRPQGPFVDLLVLEQPIHSKMAQTQSRRFIDQFGFRNSLDLIIEYAEKARQAGVLDLTYEGTVNINDRPAYVLKRILPYDSSKSDDQEFPDRLLMIYVDSEWLVPTCCIAYADADGTELLGKYVLKDVEMNPGLNDQNFDREAIDF